MSLLTMESWKLKIDCPGKINPRASICVCVLLLVPKMTRIKLTDAIEMFILMILLEEI